jgi:hypothetical protein
MYSTATTSVYTTDKIFRTRAGDLSVSSNSISDWWYTCDIVDASTMWEYKTSCLCEYPDTNQQCYSPFGSPIAKTYLVNIPVNPYFFPGQQPAPPLASGLLCDEEPPAIQFRISNKIKITIPDDPVFSGTYVWDRTAALAAWTLNLSESQLSNSINCGTDNLIEFVEVGNPSSSYPAGFEETYSTYGLETEKVYAFPAKYYMYATAAAETSESMGHRLSVGFTIPIRYRHGYGDWIVVDRRINNGIKTPHILNGSPNYAILNEGPEPTDNTISYKFINPDNNTPICSSGINELGFSFKTSASGLGFPCTTFGYPYPYFGETELPYFEPKIGVESLVEFVYDCRNTINCNIANGTILTDNSPSMNVNDQGVCLGSTINIDYACAGVPTNEQMRLYFLSKVNNLKIYYGDGSTTYTINGDIDEAVELPIFGSLAAIRTYINQDFAVYDVNNNAYRCVDLYVVYDPYVYYEPEDNPPPCVIIILSDDC